MTQALISVLINTVISFAFYARDDLPAGARTVFLLVMLGFVLLSLCGTLLYAQTEKKVYATLATLGFFIFVPIGLIGMIGVNKMTRAQQKATVSPQHV
jgi:sugar phosphate permease